MKVLQRGHRYELAHRDGDNTTLIQFVNKEEGQKIEGVTTQEILRMLIDRTTYCNNCTPHRVNEEIIWHFRMALGLHESRALEQKIRKGELLPERVALSNHDGHFYLDEEVVEGHLESTVLKEVPPIGFQPCEHSSGDSNARQDTSHLFG